MTSEEKIQGLNKLLMEMLKMEPLIEFKEPLTEIGHEQFNGLAQMYANRGFRSYLETAVNKAIKNSAINSDDLISMAYNKSRVILLKELLVISKKAFEDVSKLNKNAKSRK